MKAGTPPERHRAQSSRFLLFVLWIACSLLLNCAAAFAAQPGKAKDLSILQQWNGDYPVSALNRLPDGQRKSRVGYLGDAASFNGVWQAFKLDEQAPEVNFSTHLVLFCRNVEFYNRTAIAKVTLVDGVAEVIAIETLSAIPIEDKVAMALAVIPREGVNFIQAGEERIPVAAHESAADPMNCTYTIEKQEVRLVNGRSEGDAAPGSATKIETWVLGKPVYGDLDGKGQEDAALFLVWNPGGSGIFYYYVAAALNGNGHYRGTKAVFLGDRIALQTIEIRNGVVVVNYADRRLQEGKTAPRLLACRSI